MCDALCDCFTSYFSSRFKSEKYPYCLWLLSVAIILRSSQLLFLFVYLFMARFSKPSYRGKSFQALTLILRVIGVFSPLTAFVFNATEGRQHNPCAVTTHSKNTYTFTLLWAKDSQSFIESAKRSWIDRKEKVRLIKYSKRFVQPRVHVLHCSSSVPADVKRTNVWCDARDIEIMSSVFTSIPWDHITFRFSMDSTMNKGNLFLNLFLAWISSFD